MVSERRGKNVVGRGGGGSDKLCVCLTQLSCSLYLSLYNQRAL